MHDWGREAMTQHWCAILGNWSKKLGNHCASVSAQGGLMSPFPSITWGSLDLQCGKGQAGQQVCRVLIIWTGIIVRNV